jgi:hypothetical protein
VLIVGCRLPLIIVAGRSVAFDTTILSNLLDAVKSFLQFSLKVFHRFNRGGAKSCEKIAIKSLKLCIATYVANNNKAIIMLNWVVVWGIGVDFWGGV